MKIYEAELTEAVLEQLMAFSVDWEKENNCHGYVRNQRSAIEGNRVFLAEEEGRIIAYRFGKSFVSERRYAVMPESSSYFEAEELYVIPEKRSQGVGGRLFRFVEEKLRQEKTEYILLSTATKNHKAILHFYLDEMGMEFWNARLFKKL